MNELRSLVAGPPHIRIAIARLRAYYRSHGLYATASKVASRALFHGRPRSPSLYTGALPIGTAYHQPPLPAQFVSRPRDAAPRTVLVADPAEGIELLRR